MGGRSCHRHPDATAGAVCRHCTRPMCVSCTMVTPAGMFCSPECGLLHREGVAGPGKGKTAGGQGAKIAILVLLALVFGVMAIHLLKKRVPALERWDLIERVKGVSGE